MFARKLLLVLLFGLIWWLLTVWWLVLCEYWMLGWTLVFWGVLVVLRGLLLGWLLSVVIAGVYFVAV